MRRLITLFASGNSTARDVSRVILFLWFLTALGLVSLILPAQAQFNKGGWDAATRVVGSGLFMAGAASLIGGAAGFLFGVPRHRRDGQAEAGSIAAYEPNTNLEQISDWLTKIIVGVGLTQFPHIVAAFKDLATYCGPAFGEHPSGEIIAVSLVIHYLLAGFFQGFLIAYLWLPRAFSKAALDSSAHGSPMTH